MHVCKACQRMPTEKRALIQTQREIRDYLWRQSIVSRKNLKRLNALRQSPIPKIQEMAKAALAATELRDYRKKRLGFLYYQHREVFDRLEALDLLPEDFFPFREVKVVEDFEMGEGFIESEGEEETYDEDSVISNPPALWDDEIPF